MEIETEICLHPLADKIHGALLSPGQLICKRVADRESTNPSEELDAMFCRHEDALEQEGRIVPQQYQGQEAGHANKLPLDADLIRVRSASPPHLHTPQSSIA